MNWASENFGAKIVSVSSEVPGCEASNLLDPSPERLWLSEDGLPQWVCVSLENLSERVISTTSSVNNNSNNPPLNSSPSDSKSSSSHSSKSHSSHSVPQPQNSSSPPMPSTISSNTYKLNYSYNNIEIRTIGWYCWHNYTTNPCEVRLHVSHDGIKFKVWDNFHCENSSNLEPLNGSIQTRSPFSNSGGSNSPKNNNKFYFFCCEPIKVSLYPFIAIEIISTYGGSQTYMNQLFFFSEEITLNDFNIKKVNDFKKIGKKAQGEIGKRSENDSEDTSQSDEELKLTKSKNDLILPKNDPVFDANFNQFDASSFSLFSTSLTSLHNNTIDQVRNSFDQKINKELTENDLNTEKKGLNYESDGSNDSLSFLLENSKKEKEDKLNESFIQLKELVNENNKLKESLESHHSTNSKNSSINSINNKHELVTSTNNLWGLTEKVPLEDGKEIIEKKEDKKKNEPNTLNKTIENLEERFLKMMELVLQKKKDDTSSDEEIKIKKSFRESSTQTPTKTRKVKELVLEKSKQDQYSSEEESLNDFNLNENSDESLKKSKSSLKSKSKSITNSKSSNKNNKSLEKKKDKRFIYSSDDSTESCDDSEVSNSQSSDQIEFIRIKPSLNSINFSSDESVENYYKKRKSSLSSLKKNLTSNIDKYFDRKLDEKRFYKKLEAKYNRSDEKFCLSTNKFPSKTNFKAKSSSTFNSDKSNHSYSTKLDDLISSMRLDETSRYNLTEKLSHTCDRIQNDNDYLESIYTREIRNLGINQDNEEIKALLSKLHQKVMLRTLRMAQLELLQKQQSR